MSDATSSTADAPVLRVTRGTPTAEELAALTVVLTAASAQAAATGATQTRRAGWSQRSRALNPGAVRGAGWGRIG